MIRHYTRPRTGRQHLVIDRPLPREQPVCCAEGMALVRSPGRRTVGAAVALALALTTVLAWTFQPWRLVSDRTVAEALPVATSGEPSQAPPDEPLDVPPSEPAVATPGEPVGVTPSGPVVVASGELVTHEHGTSGSVRLLALPDGSRVLRIEGLETTDGPDLRVWLSDAPVVEGRGGWFLFDDGAHLDLGPLKGNRGDANYPVPAEADLQTLTSVSIWCRRFSVSFGAAALTDRT